MKVTGVFHNDAMLRQITESLGLVQLRRTNSLTQKEMISQSREFSAMLIKLCNSNLHKPCATLYDEIVDSYLTQKRLTTGDRNRTKTSFFKYSQNTVFTRTLRPFWHDKRSFTYPMFSSILPRSAARRWRKLSHPKIPDSCNDFEKFVVACFYSAGEGCENHGCWKQISELTSLTFQPDMSLYLRFTGVKSNRNRP